MLALKHMKMDVSNHLIAHLLSMEIGTNLKCIMHYETYAFSYKGLVVTITNFWK